MPTPIPVAVAIVAPVETPEAELVAVSTLVAEIELVAMTALVAVVTFVSVRVATPAAFEPPSPLKLVPVAALPLVPFPPELVGTTVLSIEQDANGASTATALRNSRVRVIMQGKLQNTFHSNALKALALQGARETFAQDCERVILTRQKDGAALLGGIALASAHYRPTSSQVSIDAAIAISTCEAACESSLRCRRGSIPRLSF